MREILLFNHTDLSIGYHSRTSTQGAEINMVHSLIEQVTSENSHNNLAVFIEPQLESGYPDIVFVEYSNTSKNMWTESRCKLSIIDLKILYQILQVNSISKHKIHELLGYDINQINKSTQLLRACNMISISSTGQYVRKKPLKTFFRLRKIISVEAKMDKWLNVIEQSFTNQWFSSESYILLNKYPPYQCESICLEDGTGIILKTDNNFHFVSSSSIRKLPVSYVSLLFNEWILRKKFMEGMNE